MPDDPISETLKGHLQKCNTCTNALTQWFAELLKASPQIDKHLKANSLAYLSEDEQICEAIGMSIKSCEAVSAAFNDLKSVLANLEDKIAEAAKVRRTQ